MGLKETFHQICLGQAEFWGKPGWARREAKALGKTEPEQDLHEANAWFSAGLREQTIYFNHERARERFQKAMDLHERAHGQTNQ